MAEFDLTFKIGAYFDRHLVLPLLEFLSAKEIYDENELLKAKLHLLNNTNMVDFAMDVHKDLYPEEEIPASLVDKRIDVVTRLKQLQIDTEPLFKIFLGSEFTDQMNKQVGSHQLIDYLNKDQKFKMEMLDSFYNLAKFQYECGNYSSASEQLYVHRQLVPNTDRTYLSGLWGKLASEILMQKWDLALDDLNRLKDFIESHSFGSSLDSLQQRTWFIHWSLFVFFNHAKGRDHIIDMFLYQPRYLNAIQTICPHILRYLATAVITSKHKKGNVMKDLVKVIQQESYTYRDPVTEFIECLYVNFDFDGAQQKLRDCETVLTNDFFLVACLNDFIENARLLIFETFCRIHQCISIGMLSQKLNMVPEEAERWIVELIRNARLDAKIDSRLGHVVMGTQAISPYEQVIEKTRALSVRSQLLSIQVEKRLNKNQEESTWSNQDV